MLKIGLVLAAVILAGCSTGAGATVPPAITGTLSAETVLPAPTIDPCRLAVARVGTFARRLAERLADLRPLLLASPFDAAKTLALVRQVSSLIRYDEGLPATLASCEATAAIAGDVAALQAKAASPVAASLRAMFAPKGQRKAAKALFRLLPAVLSISDSVQGIAAGLALDVAPPNIPKGATAPLGPLPPI